MFEDGMERRFLLPDTLTKILARAIAENAPDIHLESHDSQFQVRARFAGDFQILFKEEKVPPHPFLTLVSHKAGLPTADHLPPSEGRMEVDVEGRKVPFRVSRVNTISGSSVVLRRSLPPQKPLSLRELGIRKPACDFLIQSIERGSGLHLISGPTGAGKTTTALSALQSIETESLKILTIEDPIELEIPFAVQSAVHPEAGWNFSNALRHFLRQDPDVLLVGETRDAETADLTCRAALSGHSVITTQHAADPLVAILRFSEWGIPHSIISETIRSSLNQRLFERLCPHCRRAPKDPSSTELTRRAYSRGKCENCAFTGTVGRIALVATLFPGFEELTRFLNAPEPRNFQFQRFEPLQASIDTAVQNGFLDRVGLLAAMY